MRQLKEPSRQLKAILDRFVRAEKLSSDEMEREINLAEKEIATLPRDGILTTLDLAVGRSRSRRKAAIYVLTELTDIPEVLDRIVVELHNPDWRIRHLVIGTIGFRGLSQLAPLLNEVILSDVDEFCRRSAIDSAGSLRQSVNFPVVLKAADDPALEPFAIGALVNYGREEGRAALRRAFERPLGDPPTPLELEDVDNPIALRKHQEWSSRKGNKIFAAWGLAKLGEREAIQYLGEMLYDPGHIGRRRKDWGESLRAAQAIADVFGQPFEWNMDNVDPIRKWWEANKDRILREPCAMMPRRP